MIILAVVLTLALVGGTAYGVDTHGKIKGDKIIGHGMVGSLVFDGIDESYTSMVWFTNPDCKKDITISKVAIIRGDGVLIYEGPYVMMPADGNYQVVDTISPHQIRAMNLGQYMWTGAGDPSNPADPDNWMAEDDANALPWAAYTVEIFFTPASKKGKTLDLTGWISTRVIQHHAGDDPLIWASDMKNMTQR